MTGFMKIAWRNLWRNKRRTAVIALAIALGVWGVLVAIAFDNSFAYQMVDNFIYTHLGHIEIHAKGYQRNPGLRLCMTDAEKVLEKVKTSNHIAGYAPRIKAFGLAQSPRASQGVMLVGIDPELEPTVTRIKTFITEGRYFDREDERAVLIGEALAHKLKVEVGDKVTFFTQGFICEEGVIESLRVIGLYRSGISELDKALVYLPLKLSERILEMEGKISEIAITVDHEKNLPLLKEDLKKKVFGKDLGLTLETRELARASQSSKGPQGRSIQLIKVTKPSAKGMIPDPEALGESFRLNAQTAAVSYRLSFPLAAYHDLKDGGESKINLDLYGVDPVNENKVSGLFDIVDIPEDSWLAGAELEKELDVHEDWIILGERASVALSAGPGDTVRLGSGEKVLSLEVAGILRSEIEEGADRAFAVISRPQMRETFMEESYASAILIRLKPDADPEKVSEELMAGLGREVLDWGELYPMLAEMNVLMNLMNYVFLLIIYIAVAFGIANTMVMSVFERVREFGILKAIGTRPGQLFRMVIMESVMLAVIGMGLGGLISAVTIWVWKKNGLDLSMFAAEAGESLGLGTVLYPFLNFENILFAVVMAFVIAVVSALYPAFRASRLMVVESLRRI
jgi:ABC-type lipoprotein release transport system permease subunit